MADHAPCRLVPHLRDHGHDGYPDQSAPAEVQESRRSFATALVDRAIESIMSGPSLDPIDWTVACTMPRPALDALTRELILLASAAAMGNAIPNLRAHARAALKAGATPEQIVETVLQLTFFIGGPAVRSSLVSLKDIFNELAGEPAAA